jgi:hypothetical protein
MFRCVHEHDLLPRVRELRAGGRSPKEIARILGVTPAVGARLVRAAAAAQPPTEPEVVGCWISPGWSTGLAVGDHPGWPLDDDKTGGCAGLASVLVARRHRHGKVSVCGYLADVYCLGVKNAMGPTVMDEPLLSRHVREYFSGYADAPLEAPIELAREVVHGSVEYARNLGFEPHDDFAAAVGHLGPWTGPSTITFGNEGKPFYVSGPYDDPLRVTKTLDRTVGSGDYHFVLGGP